VHVALQRARHVHCTDQSLNKHVVYTVWTQCNFISQRHSSMLPWLYMTVQSCLDFTWLYHLRTTTTFPMLLPCAMSSPRALGSHLKTLPARIRRLAYCSRLRCTAAHVTFRHLDCPSSGCDNTVRYCNMRNSVRYPLCAIDALTEGRAESAKHIKVTNCVRGFVISLRTLGPQSCAQDLLLQRL